MRRRRKAYAQAGVDVDLGNAIKSGLKEMLSRTRRAEVLGDVGGFGGLFRAKFEGYEEPVLVASMDGVGTKLKIASAMGRYRGVGMDLVNHCVNDIAVLGAEPLFFLDYIGVGRLRRKMFQEIMEGLTRACREAGCALLGGETAQMPGVYDAENFDLVGTIVGVVERRKIVDGSHIEAGDVLIGLPSSGLHTNGYSLVRKILFQDHKFKLKQRVLNSSKPLGEILLEPHKSYLREIRLLMSIAEVKGMAHITGGGLVDNLPRVLPKGLCARIELGTWEVPEIFKLLVRIGNLDQSEAFQAFNMGIGIVVVVSPEDEKLVLGELTGSRRIGEVVRSQMRKPRVILI
ncbi:MAG: phosphoribosylformylglycinamidine cyclo-ligase [Verrucomicrobiae bacterium]|nr:phosphoribosylformylglycinamidine cyclo-ligase [Verrucomicrobiae bacterium]